ncbi:DMT family transporter [Terrilactibacillus laevilacticus]|uniref:DMT family transporter n=1 Tax=Terrilactibacillus laevilacticus TaxID=1380157 RepID=A0ABW5PU29_9BACI|nr:DMT family transporter [Terrilactibacillus laevilacticus]
MKKGFIYIFLSAILFSTMEIALKQAAHDFNSIQITFMRFLIGSLILMPLAIKHLRVKNVSLERRHFTFFALTGLIMVVVSMSLFQISIIYGKASIVAILFSCNPIFVIPLAHFLLNEKITKQVFLSLVISLVGIICIINPYQLSHALSILLALLSAFAFAIYGVIGSKGSKKNGFDGVVLSSFSFLMGSLEMFVLMLISRVPLVSAWLTNHGMETFSNIPIVQGISWHSLLSLIYVGVFVTGFGFAFYFLAMEATNVTTASMVFFIKPALSPIFALILIHEAITINTIIGIIFILAGSTITLLTNKTPKLTKRKTQPRRQHRPIRHAH